MCSFSSRARARALLRRSREVLHPASAAPAAASAAPVVCAAEAAPSWTLRALRALFYAAVVAGLVAAAALHYLAAALWVRLLAPAQSAAVAAVAHTGALVLTPVTATAHASVSLSCFALRASLLALESATLGATLARETLRFLRHPAAAEVPPTLRAALRNAARLARDDDARALRATLARRTRLLAKLGHAAAYAASWAFAPANLALSSARYLCVRRRVASPFACDASCCVARVAPQLTRVGIARAGSAAALHPPAPPPKPRRSRCRCHLHHQHKSRRRRRRRCWCLEARAPTATWAMATASRRQAHPARRRRCRQGAASMR
jgi:hypothetical protein